MNITRSLTALVAATLITALPVPSLAQFTVGVGFTIGQPPPPLPYYAQPPAPYPNYQWTPGYWAWGQYGYYWVPGTWVAPPTVGLYWTPGYWGYNNGYYGWNNGYWGATVGFYGGINYGYGYPGTGFYGGVWNGGNFAYNTAVMRVNRTVIHNTYYKTVVNKTVCNNCKNVSFNGGHGGVNARPTPAQVAARRDGRPPTNDQRNHARVAGQDRNQLAVVNHGRPPVTASEKPFNDKNKPRNFAPVTADDKRMAQNQMKSNNHMQSQGKQNEGNAAKHNQMQGNPPKHNEGNSPPKNNQMKGNPPKNNQGNNPPHHTSSSGQVKAHTQSYGSSSAAMHHQSSSNANRGSSGNAPHSNSMRGPQGVPQHPGGAQHPGGGHPPSGAENNKNGGGGKPPRS